MASSRLPTRPDFDALEAAAPASSDRRTLVLALIGNVIFSWSNNESLFIYILMLLLKSDQPSAAIVFATLNTTRARLDLIQRLAKITITDRKLNATLEKLIERFNSGTHIRNEFNHCMYMVDDRGDITHTQSTRIVQTRRGLAFGEMRAIDEARIQEVTAAIREMKQINRDIWDFIPRLDAHLRQQKSADPDKAS
jgi:hypothetical protein